MATDRSVLAERTSMPAHPPCSASPSLVLARPLLSSYTEAGWPALAGVATLHWTTESAVLCSTFRDRDRDRDQKVQH